jgi:hypothetical protein
MSQEVEEERVKRVGEYLERRVGLTMLVGAMVVDWLGKVVALFDARCGSIFERKLNVRLKWGISPPRWGGAPPYPHGGYHGMRVSKADPMPRSPIAPSRGKLPGLPPVLDVLPSKMKTLRAILDSSHTCPIASTTDYRQ